MVAHAGGGAIREKEYNTFYTNSLEALQQNYSLGHRLFEMDFYLTSDKNWLLFMIGISLETKMMLLFLLMNGKI